MYWVLTKQKHVDNWALRECPNKEELEAAIRENFGKEVDIKIGAAMEFATRIVFKGPAPEEQTKPQPKPAPPPDDKKPGDKSAGHQT